MQTQKGSAQQVRAYKIWAPVYDRIYRGFLDRAQRMLATRAGEAGSDILEIGAGTGLVLALYPKDSAVTGIDISEAMLAKAREKQARGALAHVRALLVMDAHHLTFADASFDVVTLPFVITLIPDTNRLLNECARVLRPGGEIIIASKFGKVGGVAGFVEDAVSPLAKRLGLSTAFKLEQIRHWIASEHPDFALVEDEAIPPFGFFRLVRLKHVARI